MPMPVDKITQIKKLVRDLNYYRYQYYNNDFSVVEDAEYDKLFDKLKALEEETGFIMTSSPTQSVGYTVQSKFKKVKHNHPMLSLGKTTSLEEVEEFCKKGKVLVMLKCDGLSISLSYNENGDLVKAETRGNGEIGEDVTENAKYITNIPKKINNNGKPLQVDGEVIVNLDTFNKINSKLSDDEKFAHPRNYASGSIRQLDTKITQERQISFIAWKNLSGSSDSFVYNLMELSALGFDVVPLSTFNNTPSLEEIEKVTGHLRDYAKLNGIPIDGLVWGYDSVSYGESLGMTSHHPNNQIAFKFEQESVHTYLRGIEWNIGKSGTCAPTAIFDEVEIDSTMVSKATLHNVSYIKDLELGIGDEIAVIKANQIIPRVVENFTRSNTYEFPTTCPSCGGKLEYIDSDNSEILFCPNPNCPTKNLAKFTQFVSKAGMDIDGLSTAKIEALIDAGYVHCFTDFYYLDRYEKEICEMEGFGKKSYDKLISAIHKSSICKLENYLVALSIPGIGKSVAKTIHKHFNGEFSSFLDAFRDGFDFSQLKDFGTKTNDNLYNWYNNQYNRGIEDCLTSELTFVVDDNPAEKNENVKGNESGKETAANATINPEFFEGKTFVFTGALSKPRSFYENIVETNGGKCSGSVSKKTNWLVTDDPNSGSSKAKKAKELGIPVLSEQEFLEKGGIND